MKYRNGFLAGAIFAWYLWIGGENLAIAAHPHRGCDVAFLRVWHDQSELQSDEQEFESDIKSLRQMLRHHARAERIARLRVLVQRDWTQIVMDRGQSEICQGEPAAYLAARREF